MIALPLFPQYADSTTGSALARFFELNDHALVFLRLLFVSFDNRLLEFDIKICGYNVFI